MHSHLDLLENNRAWAEAMIASDPAYFERLRTQQQPKYLWIGCSDSRVPANQIVGLPPGEIFVHRNVANVVGHSDLNCLSVLQFAVDVLQVRHVIVCGHYGCGGVAAALDDTRHGLVDNWLRHVRDVARESADDLATQPAHLRYDRLCELNVLAQARHICQTTTMQDAWARNQPLAVHSWIYRLKDGRIRTLSPPIMQNLG